MEARTHSTHSTHSIHITHSTHSKRGSGKTLAFLLPAAAYLENQRTSQVEPPRTPAPQVLILAPTRELVVQIANEAKKILDTPENRIDSVAVFGGGAGFGGVWAACEVALTVLKTQNIRK